MAILLLQLDCLHSVFVNKDTADVKLAVTMLLLVRHRCNRWPNVAGGCSEPDSASTEEAEEEEDWDWGGEGSQET